MRQPGRLAPNGDARASFADCPIASVRDLKGKSVAINRLGNMDNRLVRSTAQYEGLAPDDVILRPIGGQLRLTLRS